ncbi:SusC/RagA family TonB-linked outer membrane protein [Phnomibacter ginsenosidimutans]|uniref:SusC/RagA family TonB-linked outer membrane protein n=1 Tax=Phnomibacter ginsenosidimutans TaxID=2676868 RepID=A0A6I6G5Y6_9BACT|nr:SusC/RagA family TonB-linked outer membrane protein [Phnomibacter ginsenosidimutans]QGW27424.1 SusC/RagA family TonB-linked outer membrane protein [Phnomibacter ginsenosidimutans]
MRKIKLLAFVQLILLWTTISYGQARTVSGTVTGLSGEALSGASVTLKGKTSGTSTDGNGRFSIQVPAGDVVLVVSFVGYQEKELTVSAGTNTANISLDKSEGDLGEVVVTALGIQRQAKSLTYATQKVSGDKINEVRDANFANTLSGKVAGLVVTQSASGPGGASRFILRGNRSLQGNNNALIVVDGVAVDNSTPSGQVNNDFGGQNGSDGAANINPDDIESINVLKGAAASALYGSRAANGVIMITTKKGRAGKLGVDVNSGVAFDSPMLLPSLQNTYGQGNGGAFSANASQSWGPKMTGQQVTDWTGKQTALTAQEDNIKDFFRTGKSVNNSIAINGGFDKVQSYFSYANNYVEGIIPDNSLNRHTFNFRIGAKISSKLSADAKITYMIQNLFNKPRLGEESSVMMNLYKIPRNVNLDDVKDYSSVNSSGIETQKYWTTSSIYMNPYWTVKNTHRNEERNRIIGLVSMKYELTDWLSIQGRASYDRYDDLITDRFANNTLLFAKAGGSYSEGNVKVSEQNIDLLLSGKNNIGKDFSISYNLGTSVLDRKQNLSFTNANGLLVPNRYDLSFAANLSTQTSNVQTQLQSVYGTAQLSYKDILYFDATARNDWSSTLPSPHSYFYPSFGVTALLSDIMKMPSWVTYGKVRASYTRVGNDAPAHLLSQTYSFSQGGTGGFISQDRTKAIADLKPELTTALEFGTEWRFFKNRLGVDFTYYKTNSKNQLLRLGLAPASGFEFQYINAGDIENKGFEIALTGRPVNQKNFSWDMMVNMASNKNKVIALSDDIQSTFIGGAFGRTANVAVNVGGSYGDLYAYGWETLNGKYVVDDNGRPVRTASTKFVGNFNPKFTLGWGNNFSFGNWVASVLIDGRFGGVATSGTDANFAFDGTADYTETNREGNWTLDAVRADGTKNTTPINAETFWTTVSGGRYSWAEFFTYDATNVRVREMAVGYQFKKLPVKFIKQAKLSLVARNLFFLYRGSAILDIPGVGQRKMNFDPELSLGSSNFQGVEYGNMPSTRSIGVNLKLSF